MAHNLYSGVSVIIPVYREDDAIFKKCIRSIINALMTLGMPYEILIVENDGSCEPRYGALINELKKETYEKYAEIIDPQYIFLAKASKRNAIALGVKQSHYPITVLLDSDTIAGKWSLLELLEHFSDERIGGVVPNQIIPNRQNSIWNRLCNWYEDIRFTNTTPGLSYHGYIPCLIGRLYAVRTEILKRHMDEFVNQIFFGRRMETGDDRVITSYCIQDGFKTVFERNATVYTYCPQSISAFAKQRLRWSRSSFRETIASPWLWKKAPYAAFVMWSDIVMRWFFFVVIVNFIVRASFGITDYHVFNINIWGYIIGGSIGFFISGMLKQLPHLIRYPEDIKIAPLFLLLTTFVLTPVEWWGNLTCLKQEWATRGIKKSNDQFNGMKWDKHHIPPMILKDDVGHHESMRVTEITKDHVVAERTESLKKSP